MPQSIYLQSLSIIALSLLFFQMICQQNAQFSWSKMYIPIGLFITWAFLSLFWCTNPTEGLTIGLNWLAAIILFFVIVNILQSEANIKILLLCNLIPAVFIIVVGLSQVLELPWFSFYTQIVAPAVTFGNKNMMVDAFICLLPSTLLLSFLFTRNIVLQILGYSFFGLGVILIILSDTRAGILALAIQIFFLTFFVYFFKKKINWQLSSFKPLLISLPVLLFVSLLLIDLKNEKVRSTGIGQEISFKQLSDRMTSIVQTKDEDKWALKEGNQDNPNNIISDSRTMRLVTWKNTLMMFLDKPITGFGLNNWQIHYGEYRNAWLNDPVYRIGFDLDQVHNDYLQVLVDLGLPGFFLLVLIFYFNVKSIVNVFKNGSEESIKIVLIIFISLIGLVVVSAFSFPFERAVPVMMYFVFTGLLAWYSNFYAQKEAHKKFKLSKFGLSLLLTLALISFLFQCYFQNRRLQSELEFKSAIDQYALGKYEMAKNFCQSTLALAPYRHKVVLLLGLSYLNLNQVNLAEQNLLNGLKYYPNNLIPLLRLGEVYTKRAMNEISIEKGQSKATELSIAEAEKWFKKTLSIRADIHTVYFYRAELLAHLSKYIDKSNNYSHFEKNISGAIENHLLALKYKPDSLDSLIALAQIYNDLKEYKNAVQYSERAVDLLVGNFDRSERELIEMEGKKIEKTSRAFLDMAKRRRNNRQRLIVSINQPLQILKSYYGSIEVDVAKYVKLLFIEEKLYLAKEVEAIEQEMYAQIDYDRSLTIYQPDSKILSSIKNVYEKCKIEVKKIKLEKQLALILLLMSKGDAYFSIQRYEESINAYSLASSLSQEVPNDADKMHIMALIAFDKVAHLNIANILCLQSTIQNEGKQINYPKFKELSSRIENHLRQCTMTESEAGYQKYLDIKKSFENLKAAALLVQPR